jgi:hypothetical protein
VDRRRAFVWRFLLCERSVGAVDVHRLSGHKSRKGGPGEPPLTKGFPSERVGEATRR